MSPTTRVVIVVAVAVAVAVTVVVARRRPFTRPRRIDPRGLPVGVHLFTSPDCGACSWARAALGERAGAFDEVSWEASPEWFETLGIDAVPSVVIVVDEETGRWFRGGVPQRSQIPRVHRSGE